MTRKRQTNRTIPDHASRRIEEAGLDGYGVVAEIARGGTSTVYLGEHLTSGERVAIKALHPAYVDRSDMVQRLLNEHQVAERARHPGLLEIHRAAESAQGIPYLVMEYLDGESLGALVDRTALPIGSIIAIAVQVASAVAAMHAAGVAHCDLKPDNVFVLYEMGPGGWPRIKVIDFGVARLADEPPLDDGSVVGTPVFMPPEQWAGKPTAASDVYALGCVLYELITGEPLFSGALPQLMAAHCGRAPTAPMAHRPELDPALDALILRMLAKQPAQRPTMAEVEAALAELATLAFGPRPAVTAVAMHAQLASFTTRDRGGEAAGFRGSEISAPGLEAAG
ncbi:MAG TPA: serine/threonine-protein kinase [Kofleriaceae bacterium]|nr:serine/threonine-protein kinase [Kofleriaceae bacterium]